MASWSSACTSLSGWSWGVLAETEQRGWGQGHCKGSFPPWRGHVSLRGAVMGLLRTRQEENLFEDVVSASAGLLQGCFSSCRAIADHREVLQLVQSYCRPCTGVAAHAGMF